MKPHQNNDSLLILVSFMKIVIIIPDNLKNSANCFSAI